jgi:biofilm PGA synthesis N-glycosyltransferase PgaC
MTAYAVMSAVWNERDAIPALHESLAAQSVPPSVWFVVDSGSTDGTRAAVDELAAANRWIVPLRFELDHPGRGAAHARVLNGGLAMLPARPELLAIVDADVTFERDFFARILAAFARDPRLGLASARQLEHARGRWRERHGTAGFVPAPARVYRRECLEDVLPFAEAHGWEGIVHVQAELAGWRTAVLPDAAFRHHRPEGGREGRSRYWRGEGDAAYRMRYRAPYLFARAAYRAASDPSALMLVAGYVGAALRREPPLADRDVRDAIRATQRLGLLPRRAGEALGRRPTYE